MLSAAGVLLSRIRRRSALIFLSALLPGFLVLSEATVLILSVWAEDGALPALRALNQVGATVASLLLILVLSASFAIGIAVRTIGFSLFGVNDPATRTPTVHNIADRIPVGQVVRALERVYGKEAIEKVFKNHPVWAVMNPLRDRYEEASMEAWLEVPEGLRAPDDFAPLRGHIFAYTKEWLNVSRPDLSPYAHEVEINTLFSLAIPFMAASVLPLRWLIGQDASVGQWATWVLVAGLSLASVTAMVHRGRLLQREEHVIALRNFAFAHWMKPSAETSGAPSGSDD